MKNEITAKEIADVRRALADWNANEAFRLAAIAAEQGRWSEHISGVAVERAKASARLTEAEDIRHAHSHKQPQ